MPGSDTVWMTFTLNLAAAAPSGGFLTGPDIESAVIAWLKDGAIAGGRVYSKIPTDPAFPLVTVARIGGIPSVREHLDRANIQVDVWGGTKSEALDLAQQAREMLLEMEGQVSTDAAMIWISAVEDSLGLTYQPDEETGRERYLFAVNVHAHP